MTVDTVTGYTFGAVYTFGAGYTFGAHSNSKQWGITIKGCAYFLMENHPAQLLVLLNKYLTTFCGD